MHDSIKFVGLIIAAMCAALAGCASSVQPTAYTGLASSPYLTHDQADKTGRVPYSFATQTDWRKYTKVILEPVVVYAGNDNQFGEMSDQDRKTLAKYAETKFAEKLKTRFQLTSGPAQSTLRLRVTITGAKTTTTFLGPFSRIDIGGNIYDAVQTVRGGEGAFTGSVIYAVEIYDASTNRLLNAFVTKQYPHPYNIGATFGALSASKAGIDKGADALVAELQ
jgi:hypothetical protein